MANDLTADPLVIDTTATAIRPGPCHIRGFKYTAAGAGTVTVDDSVTGHLLYEHQLAAAGSGPFDHVALTVKGGLDVTISAGKLYIYLGSGPR
jgi:hypothetical protein